MAAFIGFNVKLQLAGGRIARGTVAAVDPASQAIVLRSGTRGAHAFARSSPRSFGRRCDHHVSLVTIDDGAGAPPRQLSELRCLGSEIADLTILAAPAPASSSAPAPAPTSAPVSVTIQAPAPRPIADPAIVAVSARAGERGREDESRATEETGG